MLLMLIILFFLLSLVLAFIAGMKNAKEGTVIGVRNTNVVESGIGKNIILYGRLNTSLAQKVFARAVGAGYIEVDGVHYRWTDTTELLAYMCGRIYCGDMPRYSMFGKKSSWVFGSGIFPELELCYLFNQEKIRQLRKDCQGKELPDHARQIDALFR